MTQRRLRIRTIRRAAWAAGGALFAAAWLALFVQLAQGHDPALSSKRIAAVQAAPPLPSQAAPPQVSVDPQTGQPVDPQTGQPVDPQTGQPVDPQTGQPVDPQTGQPVDPQTGQPVDPQTGQPVDPQQQQQGTSAAPDPNAAVPAPVRSRQS
ncbi:MAG: hypothetical protein ACR2ND_10225 [Solirubrobacteraceae bacterium]